MSPTVEARSLSAVTTVAADPPLNVHALVDGIQDPLILYIARVPGSHDVFLTTMKPLQNVVTAQDVESSLYYFHVDALEDDIIRERLRFEKSSQSSEEEAEAKDTANQGVLAAREQIQRKPLSSISRLNPQHRPELPPRRQTDIQFFAVNKSLKTQVFPKVDTQKPLPGHIKPPPLPRRPLIGPRPSHNRHQTVDLPSLQMADGRHIRDPRRWSEQPQMIPNTATSASDRVHPHLPSSFVSPLSTSTSGRVNRYTDLHPDYKTLRTPWEETQSARLGQDFSVTLIRRDPYSGGQWNVGRLTIDSPHLKQLERSSKKAESGVLLEMTSPGYDKFVDAERETSSPLLGPSTGTASSPPPHLETPILFSNDYGPVLHFQRLLLLKQSRSQFKSSAPSNHIFTSRTDFQRGRINSMLSPDSQAQSLSHHPNTQKAYTFQSPWNGICEFSTGVAGRILRLKHELPSHARSETTIASSAQISELRFNLPGANIFGLKSPKRPTLSSAFSKHSSRSSLHRPSSSVGTVGLNNSHDYDGEWESDEEERMDLTLGQERAGGGIRGNKAKLGKLIVEVEGLKMLDLVVAANMGVWWSVYEQGTG